MHPLIPNFGPIVIEIPLPVLGNVDIHGFGILVATGFLVGTNLGMRKARRDGIDPELINRLLGWVVAGVFIGGHLGHALFYQPEYYLENPVEFLKVWSGLSSFGGFIASAILVWIFMKRNRVPFWPFADIVFYGLAIGWFFGRCGCFSAHDHPGVTTDFWLGVYGICPSGKPDVACHDLGFYEAIYTGLLFVVLWFLDKRRHFPGLLIGLTLTTYGPVRFGLDFLRHPSTDVRYFGLTPAQYGSVVLLICGIWILVRQRKAAPWDPPSGDDDSADTAAAPSA